LYLVAGSPGKEVVTRMPTLVQALASHHEGAITFAQLLTDFQTRQWPTEPKPSYEEARDAPPPGDDNPIWIDIANSLGWISDAQRTRLVVLVVNWRDAISGRR
jgi:hypothetical protein